MKWSIDFNYDVDSKAITFIGWRHQYLEELTKVSNYYHTDNNTNTHRYRSDLVGTTEFNVDDIDHMIVGSLLMIIAGSIKNQLTL